MGKKGCGRLVGCAARRQGTLQAGLPWLLPWLLLLLLFFLPRGWLHGLLAGCGPGLRRLNLEPLVLLALTTAQQKARTARGS